VKSFGSTIPVLKDSDQSVGEPLGVERATETLVIEPGTRRFSTRGPSTTASPMAARALSEHQYAGDVLDAMLTGKSVTPSYIAPEGCILVFDNEEPKSGRPATRDFSVFQSRASAHAWHREALRLQPST